MGPCALVMGTRHSGAVDGRCEHSALAACDRVAADVTTDIRYIVLSDLHLGAANSILTPTGAEEAKGEQGPAGAAVGGLIDCLATLVAGNHSGSLPTLVASGDLLDLALSPPEHAVPVLGRLLVGLMAPQRPVVDHEVILLPGNHDHILWEYTREHWFEQHLPEVMQGDLAVPAVRHRIGPMWLDEQPRYEAPLLSELMRGTTHLRDVHLRVLYPDLALAAPDGRRVVLITHGHYIESVSKVMSGFLRALAPRVPEPLDVETMEQENWPWLDFFFSSMTRSGRAGALVGNIYDVLQDEAALSRLLETVARSMTAKSGRLLGTAERLGIRWGVGALVDMVASARERGITTQLLTDDTRDGLGKYLVSLRSRLQADGRALPDDATLVIGHTHKPFSQWWPDDSWPSGGLRLHNTGGWVVDHAAGQPLMGGAVALVSDELDVALVRLYQQIDDPQDWRVTVDAIDSDGPETAFAAHLRSLIGGNPDVFALFADAAGRAVRDRRAANQRLLDGGLESLEG